MPRVLLAVALAVLTTGQQPASIPFELINRHIALPVAVNGSKPLTFLLDTGDQFAVVDLDRARELALPTDLRRPRRPFAPATSLRRSTIGPRPS